MKYFSVTFPLLFFIIFSILSIFVPATTSNPRIPRLSPLRRDTFLLNHKRVQSSSSSSSTTESASLDDIQTYFYDQTLDHFNYKPESYSTFQQRYYINFKFWGGANSSSPILVYFGAEAPIDGDISSIGTLSDNAARFKALLVYIEHRYYGKSIPFGSREEAFKNASTLGYFNSAQAIADYAEIIIHIKKTYHAQDSPVIVVGGSYGGMLASWFRLKYPHVALGALASSAPILYFDDITPQNGYYSLTTKDFREASETCYQTIKKSWSAIDEIASKPDGLSILSKKFRTCKPLKDSSELKDYLDTLYTVAAQYNAPPMYPVTVVCGGIDGETSRNNDVLTKIFAGVIAYKGNRTCYVNVPRNLTETDVGWKWQTCSDMVMPVGIDNTTMFEPNPFNLATFIHQCKSSYGVAPRPHWITSYYGGHDIKLILQRFGSNIIFSNGLRDPYSTGGVLEDISESVLAIKTVNGSHCLDIQVADASDPDWLVMQRKAEMNIIEGWINKYYDDLKVLKT